MTIKSMKHANDIIGEAPCFAGSQFIIQWLAHLSVPAHHVPCAATAAGMCP
jgi:hypothetical protein